MTREELITFLRRSKLAVVATNGPAGGPQAAVIGYGVSDRLELVFDTVDTTNKHRNLRADPRVAMVVWQDAVTVQLEGTADFPAGDELERMQAVYFDAYPDGRDRLAWAGITHVRVRPTWLRYSDFGASHQTPRIVELGADALR